MASELLFSLLKPEGESLLPVYSQGLDKAKMMDISKLVIKHRVTSNPCHIYVDFYKK